MRSAFVGSTLGLLTVLTLSAAYAWYQYALHELRLWFSNISEVEREISMRTEAGLYFYYYKHALGRPLLDTTLEYVNDTRTEAPQSINILRRFNIYQELVLATVHNHFPLIHPTLFYAYACFAISGAGVFAAAVMAKRISGSWASAVVSAAWLLSNVEDSGRTHFTLNMRENFALPWLWMQHYCLIGLMRGEGGRAAFAATTCLFALQWQFNQYVLLLQSLALISSLVAHPECADRVSSILQLQSLGYLLAWLLLYQQELMISALFLKINALFVMATDGKANKARAIAGAVFLALVCSPRLGDSPADTHVDGFIAAKLGIDAHPSFETALYLCHSAFQPLEFEFIRRNTFNGVLLFAIPVTVLAAAHIAGKLCGKKFFTFDMALMYLCAQTSAYIIVAGLTKRIKYILYPQLTVLAAVAVSRLCKYCGALGAQSIAALLAALLLSHHYVYEYMPRMKVEQEFYDPDTVALMNWIGAHTSRHAIFTGSMQLMSAVKLSTDRRIANHPHFEEKALRDRTKSLYKIYGSFSADQIHSTLRSEDIDYFILEDSICSDRDECATPYIVNRDYGVNGPLFCDDIRRNSTFTHYFTLEFINRTFRLYKVS